MITRLSHFATVRKNDGTQPGVLGFQTLLGVFVAVCILLGAVGSAEAATGVGSGPWYASCNRSWTMQAYADGSYGKTVKFGSGPDLAYLKHARSLTGCGTSWAHLVIPRPNNYTFAMSIWHPGERSYVAWSDPYGNYQDGLMLDIRGGVETCIGVQVYVRNGPYIGWFFGGCFRR